MLDALLGSELTQTSPIRTPHSAVPMQVAPVMDNS